MNEPALTALATAGVLGITHAIEPDHVAGISSLTGEYGDSRLSALAGACFGLGHVALVVVWLAVASLLFGLVEFPAIYDALGTVGAGVVLGVLGATMAVGGLRRVVRADEHDHGSVTHSHPRVHLPLPGFDGRDHDHDAVAYLRTGLVGALFTLSPPASMIAFAATLFPGYGVDVVALAVVAYAVCIAGTMSLIGAGAGALFGRTRARGTRAYGLAQAVAGAAVVALSGSLLLDASGALL